MIFVQIAAYRDPELLPTILDCIGKADFPDDLRFGICWQTDEVDKSLAPFLGDARFRIQRVPWHESKGLCWARAGIQKLYEGEEYTLQLDSHHRFAPGWDRFLLGSLESCGSSKPILTSYAGVYQPGVSETLPSGPYKMVADRFTPSGTILFRPRDIPGWRDLTGPVRARFVSGHFFLTLGRHCEGDCASCCARRTTTRTSGSTVSARCAATRTTSATRGSTSDGGSCSARPSREGIRPAPM